MAEHITLLGAEQVERAASRMGQAADQMQRTVGYLDEVLRRHQQFMEDWMLRYEKLQPGRAIDKR